MLWEKLILEKDDDPLVKKMKGLSVLVAIVLSLLLAGHSTSNEVGLTAWPQGERFYLEESIVLTCRIKNNSLDVWIYSWSRHNISTTATPGAAHRTNHHTYSVSALTSEDSDMDWCTAQKQDVNSTLRSNKVTINVTEAPMTLAVRPNSSQHLQGEQFSLRCSIHNGKTANLTLKRRHGAEVHAVCPATGSTFNSDMYLNNITVGLTGHYWCETAGGDQCSNAILITVSENTFIAAWVWVVCVIIIILLLIPITILLVPCLRRRVKFLSPCGDFIRHQEMPRTKQDVTEIQWDLAWMEMSNLLDKPSPGS